MMINTCDKPQVLYGILAILAGVFTNWFGGKTMKIYGVNKVNFYKDISIAMFVVGTLAIAYGVLSVILRNNPHFCALIPF
jgi:ABC-type antimicrobial peptide transport system permease subunit